jgi:hypothetical protein
MTDIDKLADKIESLSEKIKALKHKFTDEALEQDAEEAKDNAISELENWLEIATQDVEASEGEESDEEN